MHISDETTIKIANCFLIIISLTAIIWAVVKVKQNNDTYYRLQSIAKNATIPDTFYEAIIR